MVCACQEMNLTERELGNAFRKGKDANRSGMPRDENPFPEGSEVRDEWFEGWDDAKHDDIDDVEKTKF